MQVLEKILEEIRKAFEENTEYIMGEYDEHRFVIDGCTATHLVNNIIRKHMNDVWISVDEPPKKDYIAVFAVDKHDYYFAAVYDKEHGYRTNDVGADVDNIVAYCLFNPYRPERSEE